MNIRPFAIEDTAISAADTLAESVTSIAIPPQESWDVTRPST